ncbi:restriction endonuclease subunit S [Arthrobacter sp. H35-D1]|uniref:restriction endonuclease subunit S n=1 Tax=Arthrobacter sp. H35-D1 TaxID=3046202 RepID=UPI0024B8A456|nr:restriction endonuclease subunit S [Arthrobacter sp. H35-D1]MDJ0312717.1 restriction endonuclease subunit S [Arthrobacter sp. H35-D1]
MKIEDSPLLQDLLLTTKDGDWGKGDPEDGLLKYQVIRATDFSAASLGNMGNVPTRYLPAHTVSRRTLQENDILIETAGGSPGRPTGRTMLVTDRVMAALSGPATCASFARFLRVDGSRIDARYLYWFLQAMYQSGEIEQYQVQHTGVARFQYTAFAATQKISLPALGQQRAIAEVLGALDDKIAANTKLAATSLDLAKTLFHQSILAVDFSDKTFADVAKVSGGGTPSTKVPEYWGGDTNWATPTDVTALRGPYLEATSRPITVDGLSTCSSDLFQPGAILMTSRATIGAFAIAQVPTAVNQGFIVVEPNEPGMRYWLFHEMLSRVDEFISLANGATFLELSRGNFKKFKVRLANSETMRAFETKAIPLHAAARNALKENSMLAATRDALLPQLMSGKLRVKDAESLVSEAI